MAQGWFFAANWISWVIVNRHNNGRKPLNRMFLFWSLWTALAGFGIPLIGVLNGGMARAVGNPMSATAVMFAVAFSVAAILAISFYGLPDIQQLKAAPLVSFTPGLLIGFYAVSATIIIPRFGAGNFIAFILLAQLLMAAIIDQVGLFGLPLRPINLTRALAFLLIAGGIVVMQFGASKNSD
jgi:bacterial/archaeal transporter family-2 protein